MSRRRARPDSCVRALAEAPRDARDCATSRRTAARLRNAPSCAAAACQLQCADRRARQALHVRSAVLLPASAMGGSAERQTRAPLPPHVGPDDDVVRRGVRHIGVGVVHALQEGLRAAPRTAHAVGANGSSDSSSRHGCWRSGRAAHAHAWVWGTACRGDKQREQPARQRGYLARARAMGCA
jgi:hypothetical protein